MLFTQQYGCWAKIIDIVLLFMLQLLLIIVNICYCYIVHCTRISMNIGYWTFNKYYYYYIKITIFSVFLPCTGVLSILN